MAEIPKPVRRVLRDPVDEASYQRMWRAVGVRRATAWRRRERLPWRRAARIAVPAMAVAAAVAAVALGWPRGEAPPRSPAQKAAAGPLRTAAGGLPSALVSRPGAGPVTTRFADGSRVTLTAGATLRARRNTARRFVTELESGRARFEVEPGGPRRWEVDCELAVVHVVGTRFEVEREPGRVRISVERGKVRVVDRVHRRDELLGAGASLLVEDEVPPAAPPPTVAPATDGGTTAGPAPSETAHWRALARDGEYDRAWHALGPRGLERETRAADAEELLALADVARLSGHPADAVAPLERLLRERPGNANAGLAAFTLGVIRMDRLGEPDEASAAFERALELGLPPSLRQDALARLVVSRGRAGDTDGAASAARRYLDQFPDGPRRTDVRRWAREK